MRIGMSEWVARRLGARVGRIGLCLAFALGICSALAPGASALAEGRSYELVSPPYKGGYGVSKVLAVAPDGESVAFASLGVFAGAPGGVSLENGYLARRGPSGWSTTSTLLPAALSPETIAVDDFSSDLSLSLVGGIPAPNAGNGRVTGTLDALFVHPNALPDVAADWEVAGAAVPTLENQQIAFISASSDLCRIFIQSSLPLLPEAEGSASQLYELNRSCGGRPVLQFMGMGNGEQLLTPSCEISVGGVGSRFNAIAANGQEVILTSQGVSTPCREAPSQIFVRLGGKRTIEISQPLSNSCGEEEETLPCPGASKRAPAKFVGASESGTKVFFTTAQPLAESDEDEGQDLYEATLGCPAGKSQCEVSQRVVVSLVQVSKAAEIGTPANVQGVVRVAPDGERVYFVATGQLLSSGTLEALADEGRAVPQAGAENLYVYDGMSGTLRFVADLCSAAGVSGETADLRCPGTLEAGLGAPNDQRLWNGGSATEGPEAQTAGADGAFLAFTSYGQLTADDTDTAEDVYRYDAETGLLARVSIGEMGHDANGNNDEFDARIARSHLGGSVHDQYEMDDRAISEDGSRIIFKSAEPLSEDAGNHLENIYEWHREPAWTEGRVSLVSSGSSTEAVKEAVIDPSGRDVFFVTSQSLLPEDGDTDNDIYDARLGGGLAAAPAPRQPCASDSCQGPLTNPQPLLVPGSVSQAPEQALTTSFASAGAKALPIKCARGSKSSRGRCIKPRAQKKVRKAKRNRARRANTHDAGKATARRDSARGGR